MSGITTMLGGGTGPAHGTLATTCTPGPWHIARMIQAFDAFPMNIGLVRQGQRLAARRARGDGAGRRLLAEAARGLGHDARRHRLLPVGRRRAYDVQVMIHTDTLNECGFVEDTIARHQGPHHPRLPHRRRRRRPRARHHQGLRPAERHPVLDQPDAALHGQHARRASRHADGLPSPVAVDPRGRRLRRKPHPQGDHRRRGHPARPRRLLDHLVRQPGHGPRRRGDHPHLADRRQDEAPARPPAARRPATTTISASAATSPNTRSTRRSRTASAAHIGSVEVGKRADLVLWNPAFFGVKPDMVLLGGTIAAAPMGDPNASIPTPQPVHYRPMFGAYRQGVDQLVGDLRLRRGRRPRASPRAARRRQGDARRREHPRRHRQGLDDAQRRHPAVEVDPETYEVRADGELLTCEPATVLPMAQRYFRYRVTSPMRLYKRHSSQYGVEALEKLRLKITTLKDINDPFEFLAGNI